MLLRSSIPRLHLSSADLFIQLQCIDTQYLQTAYNTTHMDRDSIGVHRSKLTIYRIPSFYTQGTKELHTGSLAVMDYMWLTTVSVGVTNWVQRDYIQGTYLVVTNRIICGYKQCP